MNAFRMAIAASALATLGAAAQDLKQEVKKVEKVTVTASPLGRGESEMAQPASVLDEDALRRKRAASLGDTLSQEPGVQSSAFGAAAGRPIIRGLDGPRIRVLENGIGTLDASSVSPDHAVSTESLNADQIEILRGPASLLYGSGAIGGVVNVVSGIIPRERPGGLRGAVELRGASGNDERTGAFKLDGGSDIAWHLDGFSRRTRDYRIPGEAEGDEGRLPNSDVHAKGGGMGASWVNGRGYVGAGVQGLRNQYGVPSGEGTRIDLKQERMEAAGEVAAPLPGFSRLRFRVAGNDYRHFEIEPSGEIATTFRNDALESRIELRHAPLAGWTGTVGIQHQDRELSALGEEAILPRTRARATALFLVEERDFGAWTFDWGVRAERETRRPEKGVPDRRFTLVTPAAGAVWKLGDDLRLAISATQAQRAPSIEELYSLGAHHATATFDIGDPALRREVSRNVDLTLRKAGGDIRWKANVFVNRISDFVYAARVDADGDGVADRVDDEGALDPDGEFLVQRFSQARARFHGAELEWSWRAGASGGVRLFGDYVRGRLAGGENLPRIAPTRMGASIDRRWEAWSASVTAIRGFAQRKTAPLETPSPAYTRVDAEVAWRADVAGSSVTVFLNGTNLFDAVIRPHTSYLKDVAPLMGRSFTLGVRSEF